MARCPIRSRNGVPRTVLGGPLLLAFALGCQSADFANTNIASLPGPVVSTTFTSQFVMTTDSVAGIRDALVKLTTTSSGANGVIDVNPVDPPKPCAAGAGHACLRLGDPAHGSLYDAASAPAILPNLVTSATTTVPVTSLPAIDLGTALSELEPFNPGGPGAAYQLIVTIHADETAMATHRVPDADDGSKPVDELSGLYVPIELAFPDGWISEGLCDCYLSGTGSLPDCHDICQQVKSESGGQCSVVKIQTRINRVRLFVGLIASMDVEPQSDWTENIFAGAKNFHLGHMFGVRAVVAGMPDVLAVGGGEFGEVAADTAHDVGVAAAVSYCGLVGDAYSEGCGAPIASAIGRKLSGRLQVGTASAAQAQLAPLFAYTNADGRFNAPPPAPCDLMAKSCTELIASDYLPASVTYQKWSWFAGVFGPMGPHGDGYVAITGVDAQTSGDEGAPASVTFTYDADPDHDGISALSDTCPEVADPSNADSDGDGMGDACDPCPCSPTDTDPSTTGDKDGICDACDASLSGFCGGYCPGKKVDNCPGVSNPTQDNCNEEAELAAGAQARGDACDPVPCPKTKIVPEALDPSELPGFSCPLDGKGQCPFTVQTGLRWHGVVQGPREAKYGKVEWGHCACDNAHGTAGERLANCGTAPFGAAQCREGRARAFPDAGGALEPSAWRAASTTFYKIPPILETAAHNHPYVTLFQLQGAPTVSTRWRFDRDLDQFGAPAPSSVGDLMQTAAIIDGIGWGFVHTFPGAPPANGEADLASDYFAQDLSPMLRLPGPFIYHQPLQPIWYPDPASLVSSAWLVSPQLGVVYAVENGFARAVNDLSPATTSFVYSLGRTADAVLASEPTQVLAARDIPLLGVAIDRVSGAPTTVLVRNGSSFHAVPECDPTSVSCRGVVDEKDPVYAVSGTRGELYSVAADAPGSPYRFGRFDIFADRGTEQPLLGLDEFGTLIGLTYRLVDDSVYLVDTVETKHHASTLRIVRLSRGGIAHVIMRLRMLRSAKVFVSPTYDDQLLVTLAPPDPLPGPTLYLLVDPSGAGSLTGAFLDWRLGSPAVPPAALTPGRYSIAIKTAKGMLETRDIERADFVKPLAATCRTFLALP